MLKASICFPFLPQSSLLLFAGLTEYMELPFQWDDGVFISPFVSSTEESATAFARWIYASRVTPALQAHQDTMKHLEIHVQLTDLGCGDGTPLFAIATALQQQWSTEVASPSSPQPTKSARLIVKATGVDLDEELIATANTTMHSMEVVPQHGRSDFSFCCANITTCDFDAYFPVWQHTSSGCWKVRETTDGMTGPSTTVVDLQPVLYLYLLPEALEALEKEITEIAVQRGCTVTSNRWPIPYLEQWRCANTDTLHIYSHNQEGS